MNLLAKTALTLSTLAVLFCITEYSVPAFKTWLDIQQCISVHWITDTCTTSPYFWEYN